MMGLLNFTYEGAVEFHTHVYERMRKNTPMRGSLKSAHAHVCTHKNAPMRGWLKFKHSKK